MKTNEHHTARVNSEQYTARANGIASGGKKHNGTRRAMFALVCSTGGIVRTDSARALLDYVSRLSLRLCAEGRAVLERGAQS